MVAVNKNCCTVLGRFYRSQFVDHRFFAMAEIHRNPVLSGHNSRVEFSRPRSHGDLWVFIVGAGAWTLSFFTQMPCGWHSMWHCQRAAKLDHDMPSSSSNCNLGEKIWKHGNHVQLNVHSKPSRVIWFWFCPTIAITLENRHRRT